jgi:hypothetical protein
MPSLAGFLASAWHGFDILSISTQGGQSACALQLNERFDAFFQKLRAIHVGLGQSHGFGIELVVNGEGYSHAVFHQIFV